MLPTAILSEAKYLMDCMVGLFLDRVARAEHHMESQVRGSGSDKMETTEEEQPPQKDSETENRKRKREQEGVQQHQQQRNKSMRLDSPTLKLPGLLDGFESGVSVPAGCSSFATPWLLSVSPDTLNSLPTEISNGTAKQHIRDIEAWRVCSVWSEGGSEDYHSLLLPSRSPASCIFPERGFLPSTSQPLVRHPDPAQSARSVLASDSYHDLPSLRADDYLVDLVPVDADGRCSLPSDSDFYRKTWMYQHVAYAEEPLDDSCNCVRDPWSYSCFSEEQVLASACRLPLVLTSVASAIELDTHSRKRLASRTKQKHDRPILDHEPPSDSPPCNWSPSPAIRTPPDWPEPPKDPEKEAEPQAEVGGIKESKDEQTWFLLSSYLGAAVDLCKQVEKHLKSLRQRLQKVKYVSLSPFACNSFRIHIATLIRCVRPFLPIILVHSSDTFCATFPVPPTTSSATPSSFSAPPSPSSPTSSTSSPPYVDRRARSVLNNFCKALLHLLASPLLYAEKSWPGSNQEPNCFDLVLQVFQQLLEELDWDPLDGESVLGTAHSSNAYFQLQAFATEMFKKRGVPEAVQRRVFQCMPVRPGRIPEWHQDSSVPSGMDPKTGLPWVEPWAMIEGVSVAPLPGTLFKNAPYVEEAYM
eukprot:gb/GEZN01002733.1/.p1 GENE.gb/GEZN01002733.1/~~gb/GEZN01002733.1/.p1  ORF type:complete len:751 (-),score=121.65 gb/GEZN01002733.1/:128-2050(-)